ncbi:MAG: hypothetical protein ACRD3V_10840 [Vicinamibacteria bacterium]
MRRVHRSVAWCALLVSIPALGLAQERRHAAFVFGWTFGEETAPLYGAQLGARLSPIFSIVGGVEKLEDVFTGRYSLFLQDVSNIPGVNLTAEVPGVFYGGGLRATYPSMPISPFAEVQLGATSVSPEVLLTVDGENVTEQVFAPGELDETAFTFVFGGGIRANIGEHFLVEAAFEFFDILTEAELSLNRLSFAVGARF